MGAEGESDHYQQSKEVNVPLHASLASVSHDPCGYWVSHTSLRSNQILTEPLNLIFRNTPPRFSHLSSFPRKYNNF